MIMWSCMRNIFQNSENKKKRYATIGCVTLLCFIKL